MAAHPATISSAERTRTATADAVPGHVDWRRVASLLHASRALDDIEESRLLPERKVLYQFSARGHDFAQILLWLELTGAHDGVTVYYRSRPLMLALGVSLEDAAAGPLARDGSFSGGRDIGVVFNLPRRSGATVLPACGGVGAQYTPAAGWAQAIRYRHETLGDQSYARSIAVVLGGDASCATTASGRPSTSRRRSSSRCSSTSRTTASGSPCPRICRPRGATLPRTCARSQASRSSRATAPIPERLPSSPTARWNGCAKGARHSCCASRCRASPDTPGRTPRPTSPPRS